MSRPKGSKNKPKEAPGAALAPKDELGPIHAPKRAQKAVKRAKKATLVPPASTEQPQERKLVVVDLVSGETLGPAKTLDLSRSGRKHYSHSFIRGYATCSARTYFRTTKAPCKKAFALERGSCAHFLIEEFAKFGKDPVIGLDAAWRHFILDNASQMSEKDQEKIEKGYEETKLMLEEFRAENSELFQKQVRPEDIEVEFNVDIPIRVGDKQFTRPFYGKMDLVLWNKDRTKYRVLDWKTSASAPDADELSIDTQFALYDYASEKLFGFRASAIDYYLMKGQHVCPERFSSKAHPRDILNRVPGCQINYAIKVPRKTPEEMQALFDTYYAKNILSFEAGLFGKDGKADGKNQCLRCEYRQHCDTVTSFPAPVII